MTETAIFTSEELVVWEKFPDIIRRDSCFMDLNHGKSKISPWQIDENKPSILFIILDSDSGSKVEQSLLGKTQRQRTRPSNKWKYIVFMLIWLLSAFHLLTIEEKVLIKHDLVLERNYTKCMYWNVRNATTNER